MTRFNSIPALLKLAIILAAMPLIPGYAAENPAGTGENPKSKTIVQFSYTPIYQFKTDLDSGGDFDVQRQFFRFSTARPINRHWTAGIGLSFDYEHWNFSEIAEFAGIDLWDDVYRPGISIPVFYTPDNKWRFGIIPSMDLAGATGADISESISYGAALTAAYTFGPDLMLGIGVGLFERLDEFKMFPYLVIDWQINDHFRLSNPFKAGPVGPAGLELVYTPDTHWEVGLGGAYRSYRFRLDDSSAVADGIGQVDFWAPFVRVGRRLGERMSLDIQGGALLGGSITIEDKDSTELGDTDYDPAPFVGLTLQGRF